MIPEAYVRTKSDGGKLKMRALAVRAEGLEGAAFTAATLLREAARAEERALRVLVAPSQEVRLAVAVERCACFVDALAPSAAGLAWGDVLSESDGLPADVVEAYRSKLEPRREGLQAAFQEALAAAPVLAASGFIVPMARDSARALKELDRLLAAFPGEFELWYFRYQAAFFGGRDPTAAWDALERARRLEPDNAFARGAELILVPRVLPLADAEERLDAAYSELRRSGVNVEADTYLCFAIACFTLAERSARTRTFTTSGRSMPPGTAPRAPLDRAGAKPDLRVARAIAKDLLEGAQADAARRRSTRPGAGIAWRAASAEERKDPIRLLTGRQRLPARGLTDGAGRARPVRGVPGRGSGCSGRRGRGGIPAARYPAPPPPASRSRSASSPSRRW